MPPAAVPLISPSQEIFAGFIAGVADAFACHPVDVVKTQSQVSNVPLSRPFFHEIYTQGQRHGISHLYRGVLPAALRPQALVMFVGNEWTKRLTVPAGGMHTTSSATSAAFLTGYIESLAVTPFEAVKVRMQLKENMARYTSSLQCASAMLRHEGVASFYTGLSASCCRNYIFNAVYFGSIFKMKSELFTAPHDLSEQAIQNLSTGIVAGCVATLFKMPFDVVKSRMQGEANGSSSAAYTSVLQSLRRIVAAEGVFALWRGTGVTAARVALGLPVALVAFETTVSLITGHTR